MLRIPQKKLNGRSEWNPTRYWLSMILLSSMFLSSISPIIAQTQVNGNISPNKIEIDVTANLGSGDAGALNGATAGTAVDWQKDNDPNTDTPSLIGGVAIGIKTSAPDQTGAVNGKGHWYGARVVDGFVTGKDTDIFLQGGKVNDPDSWVVGPGSVGSSKFDYTQAYLANNQQNVFFGMERAGNSGTTAFDFEFNQAAPDPVPPGTPGPYIPNRTFGDILISFEMQGSGGASGSVETYIFSYDGANFVPLCDTVSGDPCPAGLFTSINALNAPVGAWGRVNSQNDWVLTNFERRLFAEAQVPLSILPNASGCGGSMFVQVRTRSSAELGSDAKDTTPIFEYNFGGPTADALLSNGCGLDISYDGRNSTNAVGGSANLTYSWIFEKSDGAGGWTQVGTSSLDHGTFTAPSPGTYRARLTVTESGTCSDEETSNEVEVFNPVGGSATLVADCDDTFTYSATGTGGSGSYNFAWDIYKEAGESDTLVTSFSSGPGASSGGTLDIDNLAGEGQYYAIVRITDAAENCYFDATSNAIDVRYPLTASASKNGAVVPGAGILDSGFIVTVTGSTNALAGDTVSTEWQYLTGGAWTNSGDTDLTYTRTLADIFSLGTVDTPTNQTILGDLYALKRGTLQVRLTASRTLNGAACPANSDAVSVKALKAIDP